MPITRLLIANRGEIAIRIGRAAADLGLRSVAVHSRDDARSLHVRATDEVRELPGQGAAAYLDADALSRRPRPADAMQSILATASCPKGPTSRAVARRRA